jgi:hypothetical protein
VGTALTWGVGWGIAGTLFGILTLLTNRAAPGAGIQVFAGSTVGWAVTGAIAGVLFASALLLAERRRTLNELVPARITAWGALGGGLLPLIGIATVWATSAPGTLPIGVVAATVGFGALLGGSCARVSLALARRATDPGDSSFSGAIPHAGSDPAALPESPPAIAPSRREREHSRRQ